MQRARIIPALTLAAFFVMLGFFREWTFTSVNLKMAHLYHQKGMYDLKGPLSPFNGFDYSSLYYLKFPLTLLFVLLFYFLTLAAMRILFPASRYLLLPSLAYGLVGGVAAFLFIAGWLTGNPPGVYGAATTLAGLLQSPVIIMLLIPAAFLSKTRNPA